MLGAATRSSVEPAWGNIHHHDQARYYSRHTQAEYTSQRNQQPPTGKNVMTDAELLHHYIAHAESAAPGITAYESSDLTSSTLPV
jgi:hypothetical protein